MTLRPSGAEHRAITKFKVFFAITQIVKHTLRGLPDEVAGEVSWKGSEKFPSIHRKLLAIIRVIKTTLMGVVDEVAGEI